MPMAMSSHRRAVRFVRTATTAAMRGNASGRLQSVIDGITGGRTTYAYDAVGSLMSARYEDGTDDYRNA